MDWEYINVYLYVTDMLEKTISETLLPLKMVNNQFHNFYMHVHAHLSTFCVSFGQL